MVQEASAMYLEAVELMEDDGKESMALDIFRQAIGSLFPHTFHPNLPSFLFLESCLHFLLLSPHLFPHVSLSHASIHPSVRLFVHSSTHAVIQPFKSSYIHKFKHASYMGSFHPRFWYVQS